MQLQMSPACGDVITKLLFQFIQIYSACSRSHRVNTFLYSSPEHTWRGRESVIEMVNDLLSTAEEKISLNVDPSTKFSVWVSFCEIYNENIHDLLEVAPSGAPRRPALRLSQDGKGNAFIRDLRWVQVSSAEEAYMVLQLGRRNQSFSSTRLNQLSSRSHSIFSIRILGVEDADPARVRTISELCLCDLAGSERCAKTQNIGERLKEAGNINTSLLILGKCIKALRHNQQAKLLQHVPFRESKLTHYLQSFFCGRGKACMIVNINQCASMYEETLNVLKFSAVAQKVIVLISRPLPILPRSSSIRSTDRSHLSSSSSSSLTSWETSLQEVQVGSTAAADEEGSLLEDYSSFPIVFSLFFQRQVALFRQLQAQLKKERAENLTLEARVREEISKEFSQLFSNMQNDYDERLNREREILEERAERRLEIFRNLTEKMSSAACSSDGHMVRSSGAVGNRDQTESRLKAAAAELEEKSSQIQILTQEVQRLQELLQNSAGSAEQNQNQLMEEISELRKSLAEEKKKNETKQKLIQELEAAECRQQDSDQQRELLANKMKETQAALEQKVQDLRVQLDSQRETSHQEADQLREKIQEQEETLKELRAQLESQHESSKQEAERLREKIQEQEETLKELRAQLESQHQSSKQEAERLRAALQEQTQASEQQVLQLNEKLQEQKVSLVEELEQKLREERAASIERQEELKQKLREEQEAAEKLRKDLKEAQLHTNSDLQREITSLKEELVATREESSECKMMKEKDQQMQEKLAQMEKTSAQREAELQEKLQEAEQQVRALQKSLQEAKERREEEECQAAQEVRRKETERRRELLAVAHEAVAQKDAELEKKAEEISRLKENAQQEAEKVKNLSLELQRKEDELSGQQEKLADYKKQIQQVQKEVCINAPAALIHPEGFSTWKISLIPTTPGMGLAKQRVIEDMRLTLTEQEKTEEQMEEVLEGKMDLIQELSAGETPTSDPPKTRQDRWTGQQVDLRLVFLQAFMEKQQAERKKWQEEKLSLIGQAKEAEDKRNQEMRKFAEDRERCCRQQNLLESKLVEKEKAMESWRKERDALVAALEVQLQKLLSSQAEKDQLIKELQKQSSKQPAEVSVAPQFPSSMFLLCSVRLKQRTAPDDVQSLVTKRLEKLPDCSNVQPDEPLTRLSVSQSSSPARRHDSKTTVRSRKDGTLQKIGDFLQSSPTLLGSKAKKMMSLVSGRLDADSAASSSSHSLRAKRNRKKLYRPEISCPMEMPPHPVSAPPMQP
uniref:Kinesin motor domain-containing protein n=1 Tax=Cyprinodon variegatus TaxID=28743 RepID=A0A3Q2DCJ2_CYPVA